ncbi:MAG TPA: fibronectin type III domain-containing protein [Woeseiaceae bacterium]|nr:fibronectin type III domain-containing protein [Woeseiaceae bacterium]
MQTTNGSVTLSWSAPTQNSDGTPLTDLAGYRIYYGTAPSQYDRQVEINGAGVLSAVIDNLTQGTWYFAATAFTTGGLESDLSTEVQQSVQ